MNNNGNNKIVIDCPFCKQRFGVTMPTSSQFNDLKVSGAIASHEKPVKNPIKEKEVEVSGSARKRQYSDSDKAVALATLDANGGNIRQTAKILRVPESTLTDWANNKGVCAEVTEIREEKRTELAEKLEAVAHALTDNILLRAQSDFSMLTPLKDFAVSLGIAIDKMQVLKGEPTSISKDVSEHTNEERAARILELVRPAKAG